MTSLLEYISLSLQILTALSLLTSSSSSLLPYIKILKLTVASFYHPPWHSQSWQQVGTPHLSTQSIIKFPQNTSIWLNCFNLFTTSTIKAASAITATPRGTREWGGARTTGTKDLLILFSAFVSSYMFHPTELPLFVIFKAMLISE